MNILPRGVRLAFSFYYYSMLLVSIHAPTRGATICNRFYYWTVPVSIHAPTRGATCRWKNRKCYWSFNPRTHEGCDYKIQQIISRIWSFNPRTHEGCDVSLFYTAPKRIVFQSTHPRGVRPTETITQVLFSVSIHAPTRGATDIAAAMKAAPKRFNPRTHEGCDLLTLA